MQKFVYTYTANCKRHILVRILRILDLPKTALEVHGGEISGSNQGFWAFGDWV